MELKMVKAILVDLDGTLVDNVPSLYQVYLKFLEHYGKQGSREEFETLIGPSIDEIAKILRKKHELPGTDLELARMYVTMIMMQGFAGTELFPGVKEFLSIAKKKNIRLGVVTSGTRALVKTCLDPLKVSDAFDIVVTSEDVVKSKPNPEMYQIALSKFNVNPSDAVAIEDSEAGKKAARDAGLKVIVVTHGKKVPQDSDTDVLYLPDWREIGKWLQSK